VQEGWLFTRGPQSVRLVRQHDLKGRVRLVVYGPGHGIATYEFADLSKCMTQQAEIEHSLLAAGYQLAHPSSDRRREQGQWNGPDDRRAAS
jgi:hypothetical protein